MTLKQLRYLCEISRRELHLSNAAEALHTSQSGISKQIQLLEHELGLKIFNRRRNRILALTTAGREILRFAERTLTEAENIRNLSREYKSGESGRLAIAATHTQAGYRLPPLVRRFMRRYPKVSLEFWQANRAAIFERVDAGYADVALGSDPGIPLKNVTMMPCGFFSRNVVTRHGHPLLKVSRLTLAEIAKYPIITYASRTSGGWRLMQFFEEKKLKPTIVFQAGDTDVCKAYVRLGIGIAIMPDVMYDKRKDLELRAVSVKHLFKPEPLYLGINSGDFHPSYLFDFIQMVDPQLTRQTVNQYLEKTNH